MSPKKLTDDKKQEILKLYRQTEATTSTLAADCGVSSSTISRFLKTHLSESEYEELIQQKRLSRSSKSSSQNLLEIVKKTPSSSDKAANKSVSLPTEEKVKLSVVSEEKQTPEAIKSSSRDKPLIFKDEEKEDEEKYLEEEDEDLDEVDVTALEEMLGEDLVGLDEDETELEEDDDEWEEEKGADYPTKPVGKENIDIQVLPLSEASFPRTCYVVIDRAAELITRPLKEFADLGRIPAEEVQQRTLPIFESQKVARRFSQRFSSRSQRVIKVPDGNLFEKTGSYLQAKGITRLLIDGQVYSF